MHASGRSRQSCFKETNHAACLHYPCRLRAPQMSSPSPRMPGASGCHQRHAAGQGPARLHASLRRAAGHAQSSCRMRIPRCMSGELMAASPTEGYHKVDPDTDMNPFTVRAALRAAGAVVLATDLVVSGEAPSAFCCVRLPATMRSATRPWAFAFQQRRRWHPPCVHPARRAARGADRH